MKIYADVLFFINFISSYVLLDLTARITHNRPRLRRLVITAAIGAFLAVAGFCAGEYAGAVKILSAIALPIAAFGFRGADTVRQVIVFSLLSVVMAGIFAFLSNSSQTVVMRNGIMYFDLSVMRFLTVFTISYIIISLSVWIIKRRRYVKCRRLAITLKDKTVRVTALVDSGNVLREPVTGKDVIIVEWEKIRHLFDGMEYADFKRETEKYKLWLVPYHSLGNTGGLIYAFLADDICVIDEKRRVGRLFIGITNEKLSVKNEYNAIMGAAI